MLHPGSCGIPKSRYSSEVMITEIRVLSNAKGKDQNLTIEHKYNAILASKFHHGSIHRMERSEALGFKHSKFSYGGGNQGTFKHAAKTKHMVTRVRSVILG